MRFCGLLEPFIKDVHALIVRIACANRVYWHPAVFFEWLDRHLRSETALLSVEEADPKTAPLAEDTRSEKKVVRAPKAFGNAAERELAKLRAQSQASVAFSLS